MKLSVPLTAALLVALALPVAAIAPAVAANTGATAHTAKIGTTAPDLDVVDLATRYEGSHLRYRIPALTTLPDGDLLSVYDGRPTMNDLPSNIALLMRRSTDSGKTWQEQQVIRQDPAPNGYGDPSVLVDRETGRIFVFYAASINQGYAGSATGNDPANPNVLHPDYSYSDDNGETWKHRRITSMFKDPSWGGLFAASGEGIQLRHGEYAGRLIQQYTVRKNGGNYAVSAYSDDHGETWKASGLVGPGADENKTVELSDGRVMLNSRSAPYRNIAISEDGGATYTPFSQDKELIDPANNGSIIRAFPDAAPSDPRAKQLLFSNTEDTGIRRNLTVKMSCDNGQTWPIRKVVESGAAGYSTLTPMGDGSSDKNLGGSYGLLFEREGYRHISFTSFDLDWLEGVCAPLNVEAEPMAAGEQSTARVTITNQSNSTLRPGTLSLDELDGWTASSAHIPAIPAGRSRTATVAITPAASAASHSHELSLRYTTRGRSASVKVSVPVTGDPTVVAPKLDLLPVLDAIYTAVSAGLLGDNVAPWIRVTNTGNTTLTGVRVIGPGNNLPSCNYSSLAPGASYICKSVRYTVTAEDLAKGSWAPTFTVEGTSPDGSRVSAAAGLEVDLSTTP